MAVDWLSGWDQRTVLTFDHTKVDADVTNIPVLLSLDTSAGIGSRDMTFVFTEITTNWAKMALADASAVETYIEKVDWDNPNKESELWGKVTLSSAADTEYGFYYDAAHADNTTYVKVQGLATSVWDVNFKMVQHMNDLTTSTIEDSTSNSNAGTKKGANEPIEATGKIWKGQDFDGANDYINCGSGASLDNLTSITIEAVINPDTIGQNTFGRIYQKGYSTITCIGLMLKPTNAIEFILSYDGTIARAISNNNEVTMSSFQQFTAKLNSFDKIPHIFKNGTEISYATQTTGAGSQENDSADNAIIGNRDDYVRTFDGIIDELRISSIARSDAWVKASYNSCWDSLITYSAEETPPVGGNAPTGVLYGSLYGPMAGPVG